MTGSDETIKNPVRHDAPTIAAIAIVAYALANVLHEGLGHAGACMLVGGKPLLLSSLHFAGDGTGLAPWTTRFIAAAGTLVNLCAGTLACAIAYGLRTLSVRTKYFLWLFAAVNFMQASGYLLFSGLGNIGDWATVVAGLNPRWLWRIGLGLIGAGAYWFVVRRAMGALGPFIGPDRPERVRLASSLSLIPYISGALLYCGSGLFNPEGMVLVLISGMAASLGGTSGLAWGPQLLRGEDIPPSASGPAQIARSWRWIFAGFVVAAFFVGVLGPGVALR